MAEGLLRHDAGDRFEVASAGTKPAPLRPEAVAVMREIGIDISGHRAKPVSEFSGQDFDYAITVCDDAKESCPVFPGARHRMHRAFGDPAAVAGTEDDRLTAFRRVRDELRQFLSKFPDEER